MLLTLWCSEVVQPKSWSSKKSAASVQERVSDKYRIDDIVLAFEVRVAMAEESTMFLDARWKTRFESGSTFSATPQQARTFHHVFLDFSSE